MSVALVEENFQNALANGYGVPICSAAFAEELRDYSSDFECMSMYDVWKLVIAWRKHNKDRWQSGNAADC